MPKLLMLKGLPGSGKSTYARNLVEKNQYTRVNKDDLRAMLHNSNHSKSKEGSVVAIRDAVVRDALSKGSNVVVDDTNFAPIHELHLREIAKDLNATFEFKFIDTPLEKCISQDLQRLNSVGQKVILQMYDQHLRPAPVVYKAPDGKPRAILCDIDGTIAHMGERSPYDWHKVGTDNPDKPVIDLLRRFNDRVIILMSGRDEICRPETVEWLATNKVPFHHLFMRPANDSRKDNIIKRELFEKHVRTEFNVDLVLDDRNQVVDMWRNELGLVCLQVAEGDF
ncbi:AAA family ATPase [Subtercola sp. RTI3]|uniref:phosphatase domain-containing protein n=1 Tax=Subtercola sp. RTI3 TaxID=3048639 RepID=UPI002B231B61|nr:AAA family ATPase [Subtercola sp. RTI3]MEA9985656.1 AAA family ATPase [Subtercola sp. RTI3]